MAFRALLYRRPAEPRTLAVKIGSAIYSVHLRRHRRARRYTLRIHPSVRQAILTMPPRGNLAEAKEFAQRHGAWIAARLGGLPKAAPFAPGTSVPLRGIAHKIVHRAGERGTVWAETRDSGEKILCVAGGVEHIERRVLDFLKREARRELAEASKRYADELDVKVKRLTIRDQSSPLGVVHIGGCVVILVAAYPGAALCAGLPCRARSGAFGGDESFGAVLESRRANLPRDGARKKVAR